MPLPEFQPAILSSLAIPFIHQVIQPKLTPIEPDKHTLNRASKFGISPKKKIILCLTVEWYNVNNHHYTLALKGSCNFNLS